MSASPFIPSSAKRAFVTIFDCVGDAAGSWIDTDTKEISHSISVNGGYTTRINTIISK